ncbi:uncharacterized protein JCM10292_006560 [Rhodotorula paludigena]|uniref:uncharacterized protein n=1 Tax=Rhodotorula paludigena TaxID=86838 RepID=UPI00317A0E9C
MSRPADSCSTDEKPPVPPEYTVAPTVPASADALPEYTDSSSSAAGPSTSTAIGVPEGLQFHIYAASKNPLSRDQVVTGADKKRVLYHLSFSQSLSGRWPGLAIRRGGESGEELCQLVKNRMLHDSFDLTFPSGLDVHVQAEGWQNPSWAFRAPSDKQAYVWQFDHLMTYNCTLYLAEDMDMPKAQRKEVATWRNTTIAITKGGELNIDPEYAHEKELIIFSALGLHARVTERFWGMGSVFGSK